MLSLEIWIVLGILLTTHSAVYRRTWKYGNGVKYFSEQASRIVGMGNMQQDFFVFGLGNEQQVVTVRSYIWKTKSCNFVVNPLALELFFLISAHPVYKMWLIQEPKKLALWNKLHFEEKKNGEYRACLRYSVPTFVE